jgi:hypothetical protein
MVNEIDMILLSWSCGLMGIPIQAIKIPFTKQYICVWWGGTKNTQ